MFVRSVGRKRAEQGEVHQDPQGTCQRYFEQEQPHRVTRSRRVLTKTGIDTRVSFSKKGISVSLGVLCGIRCVAAMDQSCERPSRWSTRRRRVPWSSPEIRREVSRLDSRSARCQNSTSGIPITSMQATSRRTRADRVHDVQASERRTTPASSSIDRGFYVGCSRAG